MIRIAEILPNPVGKDSGNEWIKIINEGDGAAGLFGWQIKNSSGKIYRFPEKEIIPAFGSVVLPDSRTKIILKNTGDKICLYDVAGTFQDCGEYPSAAEGKILINDKGFFTERPAEKLSASFSESAAQNPHNFEAVAIGIIISVALSAAAVMFLKSDVRK